MGTTGVIQLSRGFYQTRYGRTNGWYRWYRLRLRRLTYPVRTRLLALRHRWITYARRWGIWWRLCSGLVAALLLASIAVPVWQQFAMADSYKLSPATLNMVGNTDATLTKQLTYDAQTDTYQFNQQAMQSAGDNPLTQLKAQVGSASGQGSDKSLYGLSVPADFAKGVTYYDTNSQLSFSLVPEFSGSAAKVVQGHLVFPISGGNQAIYTLKNNGLQEDLIVPKTSSDTMTFAYKLDLPSTLQAKVIPGSDGNIGIYSADPSLFGNISYGSNADRLAVAKAREKAPKTNLVFGLPSPVIKAPNGASVGSASASFALNGDQLSIVASGLSGLTTPVDIDPSVVVTSTSDFQSGNNEGNIDFSTSGQITRGGLTGGSLSGGWSTATTNGNFPTQRMGIGSVANNGYLYVIGGCSSGTPGACSAGRFLADVWYAPIAANGTIGTWATATSLPGGLYGFGLVVYNGYLYVIGGNNGSDQNSVQYIQINSDGSLAASWQTTSSFITARRFMGVATYDGYLYLLGGNANGTYESDVQFAPFNADGTLGAWHYTHSSTDDGTTYVSGFTTGRYGLGAVAYDGYLYVAGGCSSGSCSGFLSDVQYAPLNADGTVGAWQAAASFTTGRDVFGMTAYDGYMYVVGGYSGAVQGDTQYAPIYANGSLGSWQTNASGLATPREAMPAVAYNGYLYTMAGYNGPSYFNDTQYAQIDPAGIPAGFANAPNSLPTAEEGICAVAYNGYLYKLGGSEGLGFFDNAVLYASLSGGTVGTWTSSTVLPVALGDAGCAARNGYLYFLGGAKHGTTGQVSVKTVYYIAINADGSLGSSWTTNTTSLPGTPLSLQAYTYDTASGGYIYVVGGPVYYAPISNSDGSIGTWVTSSNSVPGTGIDGSFTAQIGNHLYSMGGVDINSTYYATTYYTSINSDGSITAWMSTASLATAMASAGSAVVNGCIYIIGGTTSGGNNSAEIQYACPNTDGSILQWYTMYGLAENTDDGAGVGYGGYVYLVGGYTSNNTTNVEYSQINNGGSGATGAWQTETNTFSGTRSNFGSVVSNGYIYIAGGYSNTHGYYDDVQYAQINKDGTLGTWANATNTFATGRDSFGMTAYNGYLYVLGGYNNQSGPGDMWDVQYSKIGASGAPGSWATTTHFNDPGSGGNNGIFDFATTAYNGYLYVVGGNDGSILNEVEYAPINTSTGAVGTWNYTTNLLYTQAREGVVAYSGYLYVIGGNAGEPSEYALICTGSNNGVGGCGSTAGAVGTWLPTTGLNTARVYFGIAAYDGYLYITGGEDGVSNYNDVEYAPIQANGTLGNWETGMSSFTAARNGLQSVTANGYLYVLGGYNGTYNNDTQYAPLNSIARTGHYSKLVSLNGSVSLTGIAYDGLVPGGASSILYKTAGSNGVFGTTQPISALTGGGGGGGCGTGGQSANYVFIEVTLDDSYGQGSGGAFPDANGNANLTGLTVDYNATHPPPNIRLRLGQTLQQGDLSPFDTCYP